MECLRDLADATQDVVRPDAPAVIAAGRRALASQLFTQLADVTDAIVEGNACYRQCVRVCEEEEKYTELES